MTLMDIGHDPLSFILLTAGAAATAAAAAACSAMNAVACDDAVWSGFVRQLILAPKLGTVDLSPLSGADLSLIHI